MASQHCQQCLQTHDVFQADTLTTSTHFDLYSCLVQSDVHVICWFSFCFIEFVLFVSIQILDLSACISFQKATTQKTTRSFCSLEKMPLMGNKSVKPHMPELDSCVRYLNPLLHTNINALTLLVGTHNREEILCCLKVACSYQENK